MTTAAQNSSAGRSGLKRRSSRQRSAVVSGSTLLLTGDGRSAWSRVARDTLSALVAHCGGVEVISEPQRLAARRVSFLEAELVSLEDRFAKLREEGGEPSASDLDLYGRIAGGQRRLAEPLGWERTAKDVTPTLKEYFAAKREAEGSAS